MPSIPPGNLLITGASGQLGIAVCRLLQAQGWPFLAIDLQASEPCVTACDLRDKVAIAQLFEQGAFRGIIHLAAVLPTAFHADPLAAVDVNLGASFDLLFQALQHGVRRFVFASSMSVYGTTFDPRARKEDDPAAPADPYGASKRVVEVIGDNLARSESFEFVSLRIARVVGPGARRTSSPWRSQIFELPAPKSPIRIPFAAEAFLPIVHVDDVGDELVTLMTSQHLAYSTYNTPAETFQVGALKRLIEDVRGIKVDLIPDNHDGGPLSDGSRFSKEFNFVPKTLKERLVKLQETTYAYCG